MSRETMEPTTEDTKALIEQSLDSDKANNISIINLTGESVIADYMIVASGTSSRHVSAIARKLKDRLTIRGVRYIKTEGMGQCDWVVLDAGDIIVHLFRPEVREFYNIEKMWSDPVRDSHTTTPYIQA